MTTQHKRGNCNICTPQTKLTPRNPEASSAYRLPLSHWCPRKLRSSYGVLQLIFKLREVCSHENWYIYIVRKSHDWWLCTVCDRNDKGRGFNGVIADITQPTSHVSTIEASLTAPQYGLCQGLFVAHTSIAVTVLQIHFHSHGLVKAYSSQGIMKQRKTWLLQHFRYAVSFQALNYKIYRLQGNKIKQHIVQLN